MKTMQSKVGKKYNYFGHRPPKPRLRPDLKWDSTDKVDQYKCIQRIFHLHFELERAKHESELKEKRLFLTELDQQVKEKQLKLHELKTVEFQRVKNLLKERNEPVNAQKSPDKIMEDCECRLFDKRKMLDLLRYEQEKLCQLYEYKLIYLAERQDREKYVEPHQTNEEFKVKHLEYLLGNSEIQIQTYENFHRHCESVINQLTEESLHYVNTLNSLESEVNEQNNILKSINKLGMPAYESAQKNKKYLENMEKRMSSEAARRQTTISTYKRDLLKNERNIFKHLPKDENFIAIAPDRYVRETSSVFDLRLHYERVDNQTKQLCDAAACANTTELFATVKDIFTKLKAGEEKIGVLENKLVEMDERIGKAKQFKDQLSYSVQNEDIEVIKRIDHVNEQIGLDLQTRKLIGVKTKSIEGELFKVQFAMQHLVNLLRNVNGKRPMIRKEYPNEVLALPLHDLHLVSYEDKAIPPETVEENVDTLFKAVFNRIKPLMKEYSQIKTTSDNFLHDCEKRHEHLVLEELSEHAKHQ
ncbi:uncharacterized protein LOC129578075 [Sitodiplosis mosellana]|uniref:uncharacterized protein LOC129578075 n=1 Tax=Sitodiplosis mosellana TaxID=263140 RepID=UPI002444DEED|nr:uncharacterized protein LOC129578075 [Sitodiplosis mosellana]